MTKLNITWQRQVKKRAYLHSTGVKKLARKRGNLWEVRGKGLVEVTSSCGHLLVLTVDATSPPEDLHACVTSRADFPGENLCEAAGYSIPYALLGISSTSSMPFHLTID